MTTLFKIHNGSIKPVERSTLASEDQLERWIADDPALVGLDILVLGRQVRTDFGGYIDILALERSGDIVVLELKRDRTPRDIVAQILDYASWVSTLSTRRIHEIALDKLQRPLVDAFAEKFDIPLPENLNGNHSMVIVASEFDASSKRIVEYLAEQHDIAINTAFFRVFAGDDGGQLLATDWLMDQEEVTERAEAKKRAPWSGYWFANVGEGEHRSWEDMRKYGFIAAGGGRQWSKKLDRLSVGDPVFAYQKGHGYVGFGTVTQQAVMAKDFEVDRNSLLEQPLQHKNFAHDRDDVELAEYVVGVDWKKTFSVEEAQTFKGVFANQHIACKLRNVQTLEFLKSRFGVVEGDE